LKTGVFVAEQMLELDIANLEKRGINRYKAVLMVAREARFINEQIRMDILKTDEKPCTLALQRLFEGRVVEDVDDAQNSESVNE
jgi:DNA-directed RNA polymerase subunit K/omega